LAPNGDKWALSAWPLFYGEATGHLDHGDPSSRGGDAHRRAVALHSDFCRALSQKDVVVPPPYSDEAAASNTRMSQRGGERNGGFLGQVRWKADTVDHRLVSSRFL
jgi:hypothetical protein